MSEYHIPEEIIQKCVTVSKEAWRSAPPGSINDKYRYDIACILNTFLEEVHGVNR